MTQTPRYRYLVADLLTDLPVAHLPLTGVGMDRRVSRIGAFKSRWTLPDRDSALKAVGLSEQLGKLALWVYRNNKIVWGGIIWTMTPTIDDRNGLSLDLQAATFDSYPDHRYIRELLNYVGVEQADIIRDMWDRMQSEPSGNIGMEFDTQPTGVVRTLQYLETDGKKYGAAIQEIGDLDDGPEHTVDVFDVGGIRHKRLRLGTPLIGQDDRSEIVITGHKVPSWSSTVDATSLGTHFIARGDSVQADVAASAIPLLSDETVAQDLLDNGYPRLDIITDNQGVSVKADLDLIAQADRTRLSRITPSNQYVVYLNNVDWSPNDIGKNIKIIRSKNDWWAPGQQDVVRPVVIDITPPDRTTPEQIKFTVSTIAED